MSRDHCPFRKTILGGSCGCALSAKTHLPTGCSVTCRDDAAWDRCSDLLDHLVTGAQFALQYIDGTDSLTHGKLMKVQHGGLLGLQALLDPSKDTVADIHLLLDKAVQNYDAVDAIPVEPLLPYMKSHENRKRKKN